METGTTLPEIAGLAAKQGMSVQDVMAMPEVEFWEYTSGGPHDGWSYVCSAYLTALWEAGGLFGDADINATEF